MNLILAALLLQADAAARARELAAKLDGPDAWAALDDLVDLGSDAVATLEKLEDKTGRIARAIDQIRFEERMKGRVRPPKRITLKAEAKKALGVFTDILHQAGEKFDLSWFDEEEPGPDITIDLKSETFWRALDRTCAESKAWIEHWGDSAPSIVTEDWRDVPRFAFRNFYMRLDGLDLHKTVDFRKAPAWEARLNLALFADSGAGALHYDRDIALETVEDDGGKSLLLPPPEKKAGEPDEPDWQEFAGDSSLQSPAFAAPPKGAKALRLVRGHVVLAYAKKSQTVAFDKVDKDAEREAAGLKFKVLALEGAGWGSATVCLDLDGPADKLKALTDASFVARADAGSGLTTATVMLTRDKAGKLLLRVTLTEQGRGMVVRRVGDQPKTTVKTLELQLIEEIERRNLGFEFRDVKLP